MSFRKKNISILPTRGGPPPAPNPNASPQSLPPATSPSSSGVATPPPPPPTPTNTPVSPPPTPGVRPSPISGHPTTSTGTPSLDALLSGHNGLPLGTSLLVEESGTTDYGGALLRYYAAEGIVQGHHVIVVGMGEAWTRELPAAVGGAEEAGEGAEGGGGRKERERMKIAWRYERLAAGGAGLGSKRGNAPAAAEGGAAAAAAETYTPEGATPPQGPFCHSFDLTKRLSMPPSARISYIPLPPPFATTTTTSPFTPILTSLTHFLTTSPPTTIHRLVLPSLLSPALYPPHASHPPHLLQFLHSLRSLLRSHQTTLTAMLSLPLTLYPRTTGLLRWAELLVDTVIELTPVAALMERAAREAAKGREDVPLGVVRVWKVPGKRGGMGGGGEGGAGGGEDLAFTVTRRRFGIGLLSLPPAEEGEGEGPGPGALGRDEGEGGGGGGKVKIDIEF